MSSKVVHNIINNYSKINGHIPGISLLITLLLLSWISPVSAAGSKTVQVETKAGTYENVVTETETETLEDATVTTGKAESYVTASGMTVSYESEEKTYENGSSQLNEHYTVTGKDSYKAEGWHEVAESTDPAAVSVHINIASVDESPVVYQGDEAGTQKTSGDIKTSENDGTYDYYIDTVLEQGQTAIRTTSVSISSEQINVEEEDMTYIHNDTIADNLDEMIIGEEPVVIPDEPSIAPGYGYEYLGSDQYSIYYPAWVLKTPNPASETPIYTDEDTNESYYVQYNHSTLINRNLIVPKLFLKNKTVDGEFLARWSSIEQFTITDVKRDRISAYCVDVTTPAREGFSYKISNLEDSHYYTEEEAAMIRAISGFGYWGTLNEHYGSLDTFKENLLDSGKFSQEEVDRVTDGIALTAMQQAIWHFSNYMDGYVFVNNYKTSTEYISTVTETMDQDIAALIYKIFYHLLDLSPSYIPEEDKDIGNTVVNEKNCFDEVSFTLRNNNDRSSDYLADFNFSFKIKPTDSNSDDLVVMVLDENDETIAIGRIIGELQEGEVQMEAESDGSFTLKDVPLSEGEQSMGFVVNGEQILAHNVYMLESEVKENEQNKTSQTFICVTSGKHHVNVRLSLSFELETEGELHRREHFKRVETNVPSEDPPGDDTPPFTVPKTGVE
ncbi:MAG: Cys-Gln thioester bond-forming surface protein [Erysipelotrichaceae bacterium]|nr:Cys-Gln thioester bond-forming surface protein [Erysipelotrichaceae bacterium]